MSGSLDLAGQHPRNPLIVGIGGTMRVGSSSECAVRFALTEAVELGADVRFFDGQAMALPMFAPESPTRTAEAAALIAALRSADGIILASPGYHGSVSGLLKNALDYTEDMRDDAAPYFDGRAIGCIVCAAGWQGVGSTLAALRSIVHALRGWPTPLGVGINTVATKAFDAQGACIDADVARQLRQLAAQVVTFAKNHRAAEVHSVKGNARP